MDAVAGGGCLCVWRSGYAVHGNLPTTWVTPFVGVDGGHRLLAKGGPASVHISWTPLDGVTMESSQALGVLAPLDVLSATGGVHRLAWP